MSVLPYHNPQEKTDLIRGEVEFRKKFMCPEESARYSGALEQMVFNRIRGDFSQTVIEFGSGTGSPVVSAILNSDFLGTVYGFEINVEAVQSAVSLINENGINRQYVIRNESFFEARDIPAAEWLIANPPYIPCENPELLLLPDLCGGKAGNDVSKRLLSRGYPNVLMEISSYSDPQALIEHARSLGYKILDFTITHMPFGVYSRQNIVKDQIDKMKKAGKAFFSENCYLVGSAFFNKSSPNATDLSDEFLACLTSLS